MWDFFQRIFIGSKSESDAPRDTTFSLETNVPSEGVNSQRPTPTSRGIDKDAEKE